MGLQPARVRRLGVHVPCREEGAPPGSASSACSPPRQGLFTHVSVVTWTGLSRQVTGDLVARGQHLFPGYGDRAAAPGPSLSPCGAASRGGTSLTRKVVLCPPGDPGAAAGERLRLRVRVGDAAGLSR